MNRRPEPWRVQLLLRYGDAGTAERKIGYALTLLCDQRGIVSYSTDYIRGYVIAAWPELLRAAGRGRGASGLSRDHFRRKVARHPDWAVAGYMHRPDGTRAAAIRLLIEPVRRQIRLPVTYAEAAEIAQLEMTRNRTVHAAVRFSKLPGKVKTVKAKGQSANSGVPLVIPAAPDTDDLEGLPGWLPLHSHRLAP